MSIVGPGESIADLREDLRRLPPPYLLRKYQATDEDYDRLTDEDLRCELLDGVLIVHSPASVQHEEMVVFVATWMNLIAQTRRLGRVFGSNAVMQVGRRRLCPDASVLLTEHLERVREGRVHGPMDLVVEVISESTRDYDRGEKLSAYTNAKVPEIWLLDRDRRSAAFLVLGEPDYVEQTLSTGRFTSRVLSGVTFDVDCLWSDPLPNPLDCLR